MPFLALVVSEIKSIHLISSRANVLSDPAAEKTPNEKEKSKPGFKHKYSVFKISVNTQCNRVMDSCKIIVYIL